MVSFRRFFGLVIPSSILNLVVLCLFLQTGLFGIQGMSSYPYLSGYTWAFFCDWRLLGEDYGSRPETFDPRAVKLGDTVFVDPSCLSKFAQEYLPYIEDKIILVTSNYGFAADDSFPGLHAGLLDHPNIARWFIQNLDRPASEKLIPIPIGLASPHWGHGNISAFTDWIQTAQEARHRPIFVYLNFSLGTFPSARTECLRHFEKLSGYYQPMKSFDEYLSDLSKSVFVASPRGHGLDCHRTWEALLLGCYPIVITSPLDPLFENLPVVIVKQWSDATQTLLFQKQREFDQRTDWEYEKLYAPYWFDKVRALQNQLRTGNLR